MTIRLANSGVLIHISQLAELPEAGTSIEILDDRWLSETSVQLQWNSGLVLLDNRASLLGQAT